MSFRLQPLQGYLVLIVETAPDVRALLAMLLEAEGALTLTPNSLQEALVLLESCQPRLLICNLRLVDGDGYQLLAAVRSYQSPQERAIPAIAITGMVNPTEEQRALAAGFQCYLGKPVEPELLVNTAIALLRSDEI